jgi:hypothetical protein
LAGDEGGGRDARGGGGGSPRDLTKQARSEHDLL